MVLHVAWRCTGDLDMVREFLPVAERCLTWIDKYGDRDGDGFQEFETRSPAGMENMGWKDSGESMVYEDGTLVKGPKALCELQGYVYDAWLRMAFVYEALGKPRRAAALRAKAKRLFNQFNEVFWDEKAGFYALCLDGDKKPVMSIASNAGHLLWSGIVPPDRAERVVRRLMEPDMWSGWGIRTLSAKHPAFNPNSYQNGSVWPHDNALIAIGFRRYGFVEEANRVARDISGAAGYFAFHQMPELYSGLQRDPSNFPVQYLGANVPQAWAAGSAFASLQMIAGLPAGRAERPALYRPQASRLDGDTQTDGPEGWQPPPGSRLLARRPGDPMARDQGRSGPGGPARLCHGGGAFGIELTNTTPTPAHPRESEDPGFSGYVFYTYIMASKRNGTLYIGHTDDLYRRVREHREHAIPGFTAKYTVTQLVYHGGYATREEAFARGRRLKVSRRAREIELIERFNPGGRDVFEDLGV